MDDASLRKQIMGDLDKHYGRGKEEDTILEEISEIHGGTGTQSLMLDLAFGRPGLPWGRMVEIMGTEGTGKSTLSYHILAETQRQGGWAVLLETEGGVELSRLEAVGVNTQQRFIIRRPESYEQCFEMQRDIVLSIRRSGFRGPITELWDSIAGTITSQGLEKDFGDQEYGKHAQVIKTCLRKLMPVITQQQALLIYTNQMTTVLDKYGKTDVGDLKSYGGQGIRHWATIRLYLNKRRSEIEMEAGEAISEIIRVKVLKNKAGTPYREPEYTLNFTSGIDRRLDLLQAAVKIGLVAHTTGSWYYLGEERFNRSKWPGILRREWGTIDEAYDQFTQMALDKGLIQPYGESQSHPPAPSRPTGGFRPQRLRPRRLTP